MDILAPARIVDLTLVLMAAEGVALALLWRRTGRGLRPGQLIPMLAAGAALLLALRVVLSGGGLILLLACLAAALVAHLADLRARWR
jgi:hypothetical protein